MIATTTLAENEKPDRIHRFFSFVEKLGDIGLDIIKCAKDLVEDAKTKVEEIFDKVLDIIDLFQEAGNKFAVIWEDIRKLIDVEKYDPEVNYGLKNVKAPSRTSISDLIKSKASAMVST